MLLAIGPRAQLEWPDWTRAAREQGASIEHLFGERDPLADLAAHEHVLVVGSGCSAAHAALHAPRNAGSTTWLTRTPLRDAENDDEPGCLGPK